MYPMHNHLASRIPIIGQPPKNGGIYEVSPLDDIDSKLESLAYQFDTFISIQGQASRQPPPSWPSQDVFSMPSDLLAIEYTFEEPAPYTFKEQVQDAQGFQRQNDLYSNTFDSEWHDHSNFAWKQEQSQNVSHNMPYSSSNQQGNYWDMYSVQPPAQPRIPPSVQQPTLEPSPLESMMAQMLQTMQEQKDDMNARFNDLEQHYQI